MTFSQSKGAVSVMFVGPPETSTVSLSISFIKWLSIVGMRPFVGGGTGCARDPLVHPHKVRPDLLPPAAFLQCKPHLTPGGSGVLAVPARIDKEFEKGFALLLSLWAEGGQPFEELAEEVDSWLPLPPELSLPGWTGEMIADVVRAQ